MFAPILSQWTTNAFIIPHILAVRDDEPSKAGGYCTVHREESEEGSKQEQIWVFFHSCTRILIHHSYVKVSLEIFSAIIEKAHPQVTLYESNLVR
jgi:hypothetical protein